jgi:hypothetical protein
MPIILIKILIIETLLILLFLIFKFYKGQNFKNNAFSIFKGWVERGFICFGILSNLSIIIIFFSALKLGTRLHDEKQLSKISNDQFLLGNIFSLTAAILYSILLKSLFK